MTEKEAIEKATKLIRRFDNMRILGARGEWSGNARQGFMFNPQRGGGSAGGGGPPTDTGACCTDEVCSITTEEACESGGGTWLGTGYDCGPPNPCVECNCARDVSVLVTSTMTCNDGGGWTCGFLTDTTFYSRSFSADEIQGNFCLADDSVAECCRQECCNDPNNQSDRQTNGAFAAFHCSDGFVRLTAQVAMDCFVCDLACSDCDSCVIGSSLSSATFNTINHDISLSDLPGTFTFEDDVSDSLGANCTAHISTTYIIT